MFMENKLAIQKEKWGMSLHRDQVLMKQKKLLVKLRH